MHRRREILQDATPTALLPRTAAMAFVDHDEVEEVRWLLAEIRRWVAVLVAAGHERSGRKMVKKTLAFFGTLRGCRPGRSAASWGCADVGFRDGVHVDPVDAESVDGEGEADAQLGGVALGPGRRPRCPAGRASASRSPPACGCGGSARDRRFPARRLCGALQSTECAVLASHRLPSTMPQPAACSAE
jgi:hypothetical protein